MPERDDDPAPTPPSPDDAALERNAALAALEGAGASRPELPPPPGGFDDRRLAALSQTLRLLPEEPEKDIELGTGWRRRLRDVAWRLLRPILERQQRFNTLLVEHLDGNAAGTIESRESAAAVIALLDRHLDALAVFQSRLIDYLRHINQSVHDIRHDLGQSVHDSATTSANPPRTSATTSANPPRTSATTSANPSTTSATTSANPSTTSATTSANPSMSLDGPPRACANP